MQGSAVFSKCEMQPSLNIASFANNNVINIASNHAVVPNGGLGSDIAHELDPGAIKVSGWMFGGC